MSLSRPTASKVTRKLACAAASASAARFGTRQRRLSLQPNRQRRVRRAVLLTAVCRLKDSNYYTLVEGGEFNSPSEGWELQTARRSSKARAPMAALAGSRSAQRRGRGQPGHCVTLLYPTARTYVRNVKGARVRLRGNTRARRPTKSPRTSARCTASTANGRCPGLRCPTADWRQDEEIRQVRFHLHRGRQGQRLSGLPACTSTRACANSSMDEWDGAVASVAAPSPLHKRSAGVIALRAPTERARACGLFFVAREAPAR